MFFWDITKLAKIGAKRVLDDAPFRCDGRALNLLLDDLQVGQGTQEVRFAFDVLCPGRVHVKCPDFNQVVIQRGFTRNFSNAARFVCDQTPPCLGI